MLRVGVVGLGELAQAVYLPLLARRRDMFQVTAVCDPDRGLAESLARAFGAHAYGDPAEMLDAGGFESVIVLRPHVGLVRAALECGHWVLCEHPLAYSRADARDLVPGSARLMVGCMEQYDPATQRLLECLHEAGGPECIRHLDITALHPSARSQLLFARTRAAGPAPEDQERSVTAAIGTPPQRLRRLYAQILLGDLGHVLSLIRLFTTPVSPADPVDVDHVAVWPAEVFPPSIEVTGSLRGDGSGRYGLRWHHLPSYPAYHETVTLHHEHGSLELRFPSPYLLNAPTRLAVRSRVGTTERTTVFRDVAEAFERQLVAFHRFVTQDEPPLTRLDAALLDIAMAQRIIRAYAESAGITLGGECGDEDARAR